MFPPLELRSVAILFILTLNFVIVVDKKGLLVNELAIKLRKQLIVWRNNGNLELLM